MTASRRRRGAVAAISAVIMIPVVGFVGMSIDLARIWLVSARLKTATDAASLVAARTMTSATRDADARALFWANYTMNGRSSRAYLRGVPEATVDIEPVGETRIRVTARATVPTSLFSIIERRDTALEETTLAEREASGLELAIALDQTSSMNTRVNGQTKLAAAQAAVRTMLRILYGDDDTKRNMWVSVVPFARTINVGTANASMLDESNMPPGWSDYRNQWSGCVEARRGDQDITDSAPTSNATRFPPYFWSTTYRQVGWATITERQCTGSGRRRECWDVQVSPTNDVLELDRNTTNWANATGGARYAGAGACTTTNAYAPTDVSLYATQNAATPTTYRLAFCRGANDWLDLRTMATRTLSASTSNAAYNPMYDYLRDEGFSTTGFTATSAAGPNTLCAMSPILPLTASRASVEAAVDAIEAPDKSGGTTVVAGMQGAWYTLSPNWQNQWSGIATSAEFGTLPLAYNTRNMNKAVVILTDGDNNWQPSYTSGNYTVRDSPSGANWFTELMYNAYGRRSDYNANTTGTDIAAAGSSSGQQSNADARLDSRFAAVCTAMKAQGIRIYVIGFEVSEGSAIDTMLANCATDSTTYIRAPTTAQLEAAFTEVANQLTSLRLVE